MILRAIFWIGLVSVLMPHEPDLGFGRPGAEAASAAPSSLGALIQQVDVKDACRDHAAACAGGLTLLDGFQSLAIRSMDQVRADLAANRTKMR